MATSGCSDRLDGTLELLKVKLLLFNAVTIQLT